MREFYLENYPTDDLGVEIKSNTTFYGLFDCLWSGNDVYKYIGVADSLVRERLFQELANRLQRPYGEVYVLWQTNSK